MKELVALEWMIVFSDVAGLLWLEALGCQTKRASSLQVHRNSAAGIRRQTATVCLYSGCTSLKAFCDGRPETDVQKLCGSDHELPFFNGTRSMESNRSECCSISWIEAWVSTLHIIEHSPI